MVQLIFLTDIIIIRLQILCILISSFGVYYDWKIKYQLENYLFAYKIKDFLINKIYITFYALLHIFLIIFIRSKMVDSSLDLKEVYIKLVEKIAGSSFLDTLLNLIFVFIFIVLIGYIIYRINTFFLKECTKGYLYYLYDGSRQSYYLEDIIKINFTIFGLLNMNLDTKIIIPLTMFLEKKLKYSNEEDYQIFMKFLRDIFIYHTGKLFALFFIYELIFNDLILSKTFMFCFFIYLIYNYFLRFSFFVAYTDYDINLRLFNMYYRARSIKYVNIPEDWKLIIFTYVYNGLNFKPNERDNQNSFFIELGIPREIILNERHTYFLRDNDKYVNYNNEYFIEENNDDMDVVLHSYS